MLAAIGTLLASGAAAQTGPKFLVSWKAQNYVPPFYTGKSLPSRNTPVRIGLDLVDKNKLVNLSAYDIAWFMDGKQIGAGSGLTSMTVVNPGNLPTIRVEISGYSENTLSHSFILPTTNPEVVVDSKNPIGIGSLGEKGFEALPYFFNGDSLNDFSMRWEVDDKAISGNAGNPQFLTLDFSSPATPSKTSVNITAFVQNLRNQLEFAAKRINFIVQ